MTYYYNHFRKPKLGNFLKVRDLAIESRAKMPNPGFVTATISHPQPALGSNIIVSTTIFDSAEEMDKVLDYSDTNDEILERIQEVDALCESSASVIGQVLHNTGVPEGFTPKICVRDTVTAADGKLGDLIAFLSEAIQTEWGGVTRSANVSVPLGRMNFNSIRATFFYESLADMEKANMDLISNTAMVSKFVEVRAAPQVRVVSRVVSYTPRTS